MAKSTPALGPHSRRDRLAVLDRRTREARLMERVVTDMTAHIGGSPTAPQARLIHRIARLELYLTMMDIRADERGGLLTDHDARSYLAWCNTIRLAMRDLGLEKPATATPSLEEHLAARYGGAP